MTLTAGIDVGAAYTKAVIVDAAGALLARAVVRTGFNFPLAAKRVLAQALERSGVSRDDLAYVGATGYGRNMVDAPDIAITELPCHAYAVHAQLPGARTVLDIGARG